MSRVLERQKALREAGFNPGPLDGRHGPKTQRAIDACRDWQRWLNNNGFNAGLGYDGWPGTQTRGAIRRFQAASKIVADGVVGPQTRRARATWGVRKVVNRVVDRVVNPVVGRIYKAWPDLALHISASDTGDARAIHLWHRARGWKKGGYHEVVLTDGTAQTGDQFPDLLRRSNEVGAHILGRNYRTYGICSISKDGSLTPAQYAYLERRVRELRGQNVGSERVDGHRFFPNQATSCPGVMDVAAIKIKAGVN